jgi:hypothetical protein
VRESATRIELQGGGISARATLPACRPGSHVQTRECPAPRPEQIAHSFCRGRATQPILLHLGHRVCGRVSIGWGAHQKSFLNRSAWLAQSVHGATSGQVLLPRRLRLLEGIQTAAAALMGDAARACTENSAYIYVFKRWRWATRAHALRMLLVTAGSGCWACSATASFAPHNGIVACRRLSIARVVTCGAGCYKRVSLWLAACCS